jgi:hypothetical protein
MLTVRQYLRTLDKETLYKLFEISDLTEDEYWLLRYAFIEKRMRENTCMKLNIGSTKYATMLNIALIKVEYKIKELDKLRTFS